MEVHAELDTRSKMFCRCAVAFGGEPNTRVCPVCLGLPGSLPVPNETAIDMVLRTALALNCQINLDSKFERKNYFYPDLPKGYQISQYTHPIGHSGRLELPTKDGGMKSVHIQRVHLEEDTGKLIHLATGESGIDFNRAGVPLMEIVTAFPPDLETPEEAKEYLVQLRLILMHLGVCDGKMEEGSLRAEPNISVRPAGSDRFGTKTELKNLGSFRAVQLGVGYEILRQTALIEAGRPVEQETRGWHEAREESFLMRRKETENDYRYFPDPDLAPLHFTRNDVDSVRTGLPELPLARERRYIQMGVKPQHAATLVADLRWAKYFDHAAALADPQAVANWLLQDFAMRLNEEGISPDASRVPPEALAELIQLIGTGAISGKIAKDVLAEMVATGKKPRALVESKGLTQLTEREPIAVAVRTVFELHPDVVAKYRSGNANVKGFLVGQVMRETEGRASPEMVQQMVQEALEG